MSPKAEPLLYEVFDPSVTNFVTPRIYRILYAIVIAFTIAAVGIAEFQLTRSSGFPLWGLILLGLGIPVVACLLVLVIRMTYELTLVFFRTEEHLRELRASAQPQNPPASAPAFFQGG